MAQNKDNIKLNYLVIFKRFYARIKHLFRFSEIISWKYETCGNCGIEYRLVLGIYDKKWIEVNGRSEGCLCLTCFLKKADSKDIQIKVSDIRDLWLFNPKGECSDIILKGEIHGTKILPVY